MVLIDESLQRVRAYIEREKFAGYDPYDVLNGWLRFERWGKWPAVIAIQLHKRSYLNLRRLFGIKKGINPKAIGLLLNGYSTLYESTGAQEYLETAQWLFQWLTRHTTSGYSGACWGYNFGWASPSKYLAPYTPSVVVTGFVAKGIHRYYEVTKDEQAAIILRDACDFVLKDIPRTETKKGICFSYTPVRKDRCFNASLLAAETLARAYATTGEDELRDYVLRSAEFVIDYQFDDGKWLYEIRDDETQDPQLDFHQGYVVESLFHCGNYARIWDERIRHSVDSGAEFYRVNQFDEEGRSFFRLPREWPADIHNQAQGILTFAMLADRNDAYLPKAKKIAEWTINQMQGADGHFYYRKGKFTTNKISYMRWSQAWMFLSLAVLSARIKESQ